MRESTKATSDYRYDFGLYDEVLDKDPYVVCCRDQRKSAVLHQDRVVQPGDDSDRGIYAARFVEACFRQLTYGPGDGGFQRDLSDLMDAVTHGIAVEEVIWGETVFAVQMDNDTRPRSRAWFVPLELKQRHPRRFKFDKDDIPKLMTEENPNGEDIPARKFIFFRPYARYDDPYGWAYLRPIWWLTWFKRKIMYWWVSYCERFGSPTIVGILPPVTTSTERDELDRAIKGVMQEQTVTMPNGGDIKTLESNMASINNYREFMAYVNGEIGKCLLGQTLTSDVGKGGNLSVSEVHERVALSVQAMDARNLEDCINGTLIPWMIELNLPGYPIPRMEIITDNPRDRIQLLQLILGNGRGLAESNYQVSKSDVLNLLGIKQARNDDDVLELNPATYSDGFGSSASTTDAKTKKRADERESTSASRARNPGRK